METTINGFTVHQNIGGKELPISYPKTKWIPTKFKQLPKRANGATRLSEVFINERTRYTILARTENILFLQAEKMLFNSQDLTLPVLDAKGQQFFLKPYWCIGTIRCFPDPILDGFGNKTYNRVRGQNTTVKTTENREHIHVNPIVEITLENSRGIPIPGGIGFNADPDQVYHKYLEVIKERGEN